MISANTIYSLSPNDRKIMILNEIRNIHTLQGLQVDQAISNVINTFIKDYINIKITNDNLNSNGSILTSYNLSIAIDREISLFKPSAIQCLRSLLIPQNTLVASSKNIYEMAGASKLAFANMVTRNISTTTGLFWEKLAALSPYSINPEREFNLKIKGIDLISMNCYTGVIEYQQLKTQHNTLTGSQVPRTIEELQIHINPIFCASFTNNSSWTFNHHTIPKVSGADFWNRIGIDYVILRQKALELIRDLEYEFTLLI